MDDLTWAALGATLTLIGLALSFRAYQRRGVTAGLRGAAWSLLPLAAGLTGALELVGDVAADVSDFAAHFAFSPLAWLGFVVAATSVVLFVLTGVLRHRRAEAEPRGGQALPKEASRKPAKAPVDEDMAEIEAILRKHGIQ